MKAALIVLFLSIIRLGIPLTVLLLGGELIRRRYEHARLGGA